MAADRTSWHQIAELRDAIRRDALVLRHRGSAMYERLRRARVAQKKWLGLLALARTLATLFWRWRNAKGVG